MHRRAPRPVRPPATGLCRPKVSTVEKEHYHETKKYRCLVEHAPHPSEALYLILCGMEYCAPNKSYGPNRRAGYHLHVILSGEGTLEVSGHQYRLHTGQMFLEKPNELTYYYPNKEKPWTYCWVAFDGTAAAGYMEEAGFTRGVNTRNSYVDTKDFYRLADALLDKPNLQMASCLRRFGLLNEFIALAVESNYRSGEGHKKIGHTAGNYIDHAIDFIERNYSSIKVADISSYIGVNRSYFANLFKQHTGVSPCEYLFHVRLQKSAQLLLNTALPIQDVAEYVGYENPLTFSKAFKKAFGVSPKYYRIQPEQERVTLPEIEYRTKFQTEW